MNHLNRTKLNRDISQCLCKHFLVSCLIYHMHLAEETKARMRALTSQHSQRWLTRQRRVQGKRQFPLWDSHKSTTYHSVWNGSSIRIILSQCKPQTRKAKVPSWLPRNSPWASETCSVCVASFQRHLCAAPSALHWQRTLQTLTGIFYLQPNEINLLNDIHSPFCPF